MPWPVTTTPATSSLAVAFSSCSKKPIIIGCVHAFSFFSLANVMVKMPSERLVSIGGALPFSSSSFVLSRRTPRWAVVRATPRWAAASVALLRMANIVIS